MPKKVIKFILSEDTDEQFKAALKRRTEDFPTYRLIDVTREEIQQDGVPIGVGVITLDL